MNWTSAAAGTHAQQHAHVGRMAVIMALLEHGPLNDYQLSVHTRWRMNSICKRRLEAQRLGWVQPYMDKSSGRQFVAPTDSGCVGLVWELTADGKHIAKQLVKHAKKQAA